MKRKLYIMAVVAGVAVVSGLNASAISIGYSSVVGTHHSASQINFDGSGNFSFSADNLGDYFSVSSSTGTGDSIGNLGTLLSGTFAIGTVTTALNGTQSANVTGSGTLTINDGDGFNLTGALSWVNIVQSGTGTSLNLKGDVNLTGVTYGGTSADLLALVGNDSDSLSFTFNPAKTLTTLTTTKVSTGFSGQITSVPDGGMTVMLLGAALSTMGLLRKKLMA